MRQKKLLILILSIIILSALLLIHISENDEWVVIKKHMDLQYSESVNKDLGPHTEQYRQYFPVETGTNKIEVRLRVTEFDSGDYGKIHLKLYDNNDQLVASDMFYPLEKYINVDYNGNMSAGDWHMVVSVEDGLGVNTINVAGNINVFGDAVYNREQ